MEKFTVLWTTSAKMDLVNIVQYVSLEDRNAAKDIYFKLKKKGEKLSAFPFQGRTIPELKNYHVDLYREIIENTWRILYKISNSEVIVLAVIDGRRNIEDIIFDKLMNL